MNQFTEGFVQKGTAIATPGEAVDTSIIDEPMPEENRTRVGVFKHQLVELSNECRACKRRGRTVPYLYNLGWSAWTASIYAGIGWFVSDHTNPTPSHKVFLMYQLGVLVLALAGLLLLVWGWSARRANNQDLEALAVRIDRLNYTDGL